MMAPLFSAPVSANARNAAGFANSINDGGCCEAAPPTLLNFNHREHSMNKDQTKGRVEEVKGKVKEIAGKLSGDKKLEDEGKLQNLKGQVQAGFGDLKEDIKKAV
ncbi:MAG: CsbD family protein [Sulfuritalea sp.]|nr:CsbD family protein [Sulfuritalea sp.]